MAPVYEQKWLEIFQTHSQQEDFSDRQLPYFEPKAAVPLPTSIALLEQLRVLRLCYSWSDLDSLKYLPLLQQLSIYDNQALRQLPACLPECAQLCHLSLDDCPELRQLDWAMIGQLHALEYLYINKAGLDQAPAAWAQLSQLRILQLCGGSFRKIPIEWKSLTSLTSVSFQNNPHLQEFPAPVVHWQQLYELHLDPRILAMFPRALLDLPQLKIIGFVPNKRYPQNKLLVEWLLHPRREAQHPQAWPQDAATKDLFYQAMMGQLQYEDLPLPQLLFLAYCGIKDIERKATAQLQRGLEKAQWGQAFTLPSQQALFYADGTLAHNLRTRIKALGIKIASKYSPKVSHLIIGKKPLLDWLDKANEQGIWPFAMHNEKTLVQQLNQLDQPYLLEVSAKDHQALADLLLSPEESNVEIALTMMQKGGIPAELLTILFLRYRDGHHRLSAHLKLRLRKLFDQEAPLVWSAALTKRFAEVHDSPSLRQMIRVFSRYLPLDKQWMAYYFRQVYGQDYEDDATI